VSGSLILALFFFLFLAYRFAFPQLVGLMRFLGPAQERLFVIRLKDKHVKLTVGQLHGLQGILCRRTPGLVVTFDEPFQDLARALAPDFAQRPDSHTLHFDIAIIRDQAPQRRHCAGEL